MELSEQLMLNISKDNLIVDPMLRDQVNYILERKGILRVNEMYSEFGISKVGLRNNFINKIGLTPKKVSQIWRLNYFLYLQQNTSCQNLTQLGLDAGFYDQAHFIKEFKSFFHCSPLHFFKNEHHLLKISQETISKRLFNVYDPVNWSCFFFIDIFLLNFFTIFGVPSELTLHGCRKLLIQILFFD